MQNIKKINPLTISHINNHENQINEYNKKMDEYQKKNELKSIKAEIKNKKKEFKEFKKTLTKKELHFINAHQKFMIQINKKAS